MWSYWWERVGQCLLSRCIGIFYYYKKSFNRSRRKPPHWMDWSEGFNNNLERTFLVFWGKCSLFITNHLQDIHELYSLFRPWGLFSNLNLNLKEQLEVCLTCCRLRAGIPMLIAIQNLRCSNNRMTLYYSIAEETPRSKQTVQLMNIL